MGKFLSTSDLAVPPFGGDLGTGIHVMDGRQCNESLQSLTPATAMGRAHFRKEGEKQGASFRGPP